MNQILIPIYNDWKSLTKLLLAINKNPQYKIKNSILIVDDNSKIKPLIDKKKLKNIKKIEILSLKKNIGSQKAIAVGLNYLNKKKKDFDFVTIMDGDGEDNPKKIFSMIKVADQNRNSVVVSCRKKRKENFVIKYLYKMHLIITFLFTGNWISFGNFSCFFYKNLKKILSDNSIWYAYSAGIMKNTNVKKVYASREKRYFDKTKVNFFFLFFHSLRIIGVFYKKLIFLSFLYLLMINILSIKYLHFFNFLIVSFVLIIFLIRTLSKKEKLYKFTIEKIK